MLVAGFSCVDYSTLNVKAKDKNRAEGESHDTLAATIGFADITRVPIVILENIKNCPWEIVRRGWDRIGYTSHYIQVDSKDYYIPHTRQRGYMICIERRRMETFVGPEAAKKWATEIALHWERLMWALERKSSSPFTAFLLQPDDDRLHRSTQELTKAYLDDPTIREINWSVCLQRHLTYRALNGLGDGRPVTEWQENGPSKMVDFGNIEWSRAQSERVKDTLDICLLRNAAKENGKYFDHDYKA